MNGWNRGKAGEEKIQRESEGILGWSLLCVCRKLIYLMLWIFF